MGVLQIMIKKILKTGSICLLGLAVATGARMYVGSGLFASEKDNTVVNAAVRKVNLNYTSLSLGKGEKIQLAANQVVEWSSSNDNILSVDEKGQVTAMAEGSASIVAAAGDETGLCHITVKKEPLCADLDFSSLTLGRGESYKLNLHLPDGTAAAVRTFRSNNEKVVKMTKTNWRGEFTAVGTGSAIVTAKLYNGLEANCRITVKKEPSSVDLNYSSLKLGLGESFRLSAVLPYNCGAAVRTYSSSNNKIIKMTKTNWNGEFKAVGTGTAWVTVKLYNGKQGHCKITVKNAPGKISLNKSIMYMRVGDTGALNLILPDNSASALRTFRSSNSSIIKMTKTNWSAQFKAVGEGTAWVTVRLYNGVEKSCKIIVSKKPDIQVINGVTYIDGILIVNKTYSLPSSYGSGLDKTALSAFNKMAAAASREGIYLNIVSGFRSYYTQSYLYNSYCSSRGQAAADRFSARPGHSEHQSGLAMDINSVYDSFAYTAEAKWMKKNCHKYGFIIRYPEGKESITGYKYESWHIRYVGSELATTLYNRGITLEEYFGITSRYS